MKFTALVFALCLVPVAAFAQDKHHKSKNGGQLADAGSYHVEAVAKDTTLTVYLTDHDTDKPIATAGFKGLAILVVDGKSQRITLAPQGHNMLVGNSAAALKAPIRGAIQVTNSKNVTVQAKF
jgi:hypothetical protein